MQVFGEWRVELFKFTERQNDIYVIAYLFKLGDADGHRVFLELTLVHVFAQQLLFADSDAVAQSLELLLKTLLNAPLFNPVENECARNDQDDEPDEELEGKRHFHIVIQDIDLLLKEFHR